MAIPVMVVTVVKGIHSAATHTSHFASKHNLINTASNLNDIISNVRTDTTDKTKKHENHISKLFQKWKDEQPLRDIEKKLDNVDAPITSKVQAIEEFITAQPEGDEKTKLQKQWEKLKQSPATEQVSTMASFIKDLHTQKTQSENREEKKGKISQKKMFNMHKDKFFDTSLELKKMSNPSEKKASELKEKMQFHLEKSKQICEKTSRPATKKKMNNTITEMTNTLPNINTP